MKLKLSNSEMLCLVEVLNKSCEQIRDQIRAEAGEDNRYLMMFLSIFEAMHLDYYKRSLEVKKTFGITMTAFQALAFHISFNGKGDLKTPVGNLVQGICNEIFQTHIVNQN